MQLGYADSIKGFLVDGYLLCVHLCVCIFTFTLALALMGNCMSAQKPTCARSSKCQLTNLKYRLKALALLTILSFSNCKFVKCCLALHQVSGSCRDAVSTKVQLITAAHPLKEYILPTLPFKPLPAIRFPTAQIYSLFVVPELCRPSVSSLKFCKCSLIYTVPAL